MDAPAHFTKKPVTIEAIELTRDNKEVVLEWVGEDAVDCKLDPGCVLIRTLEGDMHSSVGDFVIKGVDGEFYPCKPAIFAQSYEKEES